MNVNGNENENDSAGGAANAAQSAAQGAAQGAAQNPARTSSQGRSGSQNMQGTGQPGQAAQSTQSGGVSTRDQTGAAQGRGAILIPPVDVIEDVGGITLLADMPGVARDKLDLRLETNSLTIQGELSLDLPGEMESRYAEIKHQYYQRTFALSRELDGEKAVAELNHGVLRIRIPKTAQAQPRRIQINAG